MSLPAISGSQPLLALEAIGIHSVWSFTPQVCRVTSVPFAALLPRPTHRLVSLRSGAYRYS